MIGSNEDKLQFHYLPRCTYCGKMIVSIRAVYRDSPIGQQFALICGCDLVGSRTYEKEKEIRRRAREYIRWIRRQQADGEC